MTSFVENGTYSVDRVDLPRRKTNLIIFLIWNLLLVLPILSGAWSLIRAGLLVSVPSLLVMLISGE